MNLTDGINVFISCAMTHVPKKSFSLYFQYINQIASCLDGLGLETHHAFKDSDPFLAKVSKERKATECYKMDRLLVEKSSLVVAEASFPSIGLGIELEIAHSLGIPAIITFSEVFCKKADSKRYILEDSNSYSLQIGEGFVTLMAIGLPNMKGVVNCTQSFGDLEKLVRHLLLGSDSEKYTI